MDRSTIPICRISVSSTGEAVPEKMKDQSANYPRVKVREEKDSDDYPAVYEQKRSYLFSLKDLESLLLQDSSNSPGKEHRVSPSFSAKILKACSPNEIKPSTFESQEAERRCKMVDENNKANIRASSIPMPRVVISGPGKEHCVSPSFSAKILKACSPNEIKSFTSESQEVERRCKMVDEDNKANIRASSIPMPRAIISNPENDQMIGKKNRKTTEKPSVLKNRNSVQPRHSQCKIIASHSGNENPISSRRSKDTADSKCRSIGKNGTACRGGSFMSKTTP